MKQYPFHRQQRLLDARDYTRVFDHNQARISHHAFLILALRISSERPARLGLIASKKHLKRAVQRNKFKRTVRESFRQYQHDLRGIDLIVMARAGALNITAKELRNALDQAWPRLGERLPTLQTIPFATD